MEDGAVTKEHILHLESLLWAELCSVIICLFIELVIFYVRLSDIRLDLNPVCRHVIW
jgi:hypothetical protein